jgi:hypothetical protein
MRLTKRRIAWLLAGSAVAGGLAGRVTHLLHEQKRARMAKPRASGQPAPARRPPGPLEVAESVFDGKLGVGWRDWGWGRHEFAAAGPARVSFGGYAGIAFHRQPELPSDFGGLAFRYKAPPGWGAFLSVSLKQSGADTENFPQVDLEPSDLTDAGDGWTEAWVSWARLNPRNRPIDRLVISASKQVDPEWVALDKVVLTKREGPAREAPERDAAVAIECEQPTEPISPLIYGIASKAWESGGTAFRIGGNPTTRLNWELGTWNAGSDWFFENASGSSPVWDTVSEAVAHHAKTAVTVPMLGWVAKDGTSVGFPSAKFPQQKAHDPQRPEAGNGIAPDGSELRPGAPSETSVPAPPETIAKWIATLREKDTARGVAMYILDNEPSLWSDTHRDVHPEPVGQDELLERTVRYASAIRRADPEALIAGPAEWGWTGYFYSGKDRELGVKLRPDRRAHGDLPLLVWYLQKLAEYEKAKGVKLLDVLDVHYYPQAERIYGANARTDREGAALRVRSTRSLWDPGYTDESWIHEPVRLIPRLREWVEQNHPGLKLSLGEWSFGGDGHISGALATAEALGRFGQHGLYSAFYWDGPKPNTATFWAFRAFRDFDGAGGHFLDLSLKTREAENLSLFASRDADGTHVVAVLVNRDPTYALRARVAMSTCGKVVKRRAFTYAGAPGGLTEEPPAVIPGDLVELVPPYSIRVVDLALARGQ